MKDTGGGFIGAEEIKAEIARSMRAVAAGDFEVIYDTGMGDGITDGYDGI